MKFRFYVMLTVFLSIIAIPDSFAVEVWMKVDGNGNKTNSMSNGGNWATPTTARFYNMDPGFNDSTPNSGVRRLYSPNIDHVVQLVGEVTGHVLDMNIRLAHVYLKVSKNATNGLPYDATGAKCHRRETNELHIESPINNDPWAPPHYCSTVKLTPADAYDKWNVNQVLLSFNPVANNPNETGWENYLERALRTAPRDNYRGVLHMPVCQELSTGNECKNIELKVNLEVSVDLTSVQLSQDEAVFTTNLDPVTRKVRGVASVYAMLSGQFGRALTVEVKNGSTQGKLTNSQTQSEIPYIMDATLTRTNITERLLDGRTGLRNPARFSWIYGTSAQVQFDFSFEQDSDVTPAGTYTDNMVIMFGTEV